MRSPLLPIPLLIAAAPAPADKRFDAIWQDKWRWRAADQIADSPPDTVEALGPKFDLRHFHDTVFSLGPMPSPVFGAARSLHRRGRAVTLSRQLT